MNASLRAAVLAALAVRGTTLQAQDTRIRGFTDVTVSASEAPGTRPAFALGQFDLFITSRLTDQVSFLGEVVFEYDQQFIVDVERVVVTYAPRNWLRISAGKHHTPIGYWNTAYHHGTLLQPTIRRPVMFLFEDEGGVLPIHTTGIAVTGRDISPLHLGFDLMVGNGVGSTPVSDNNNAKSVTLALQSQVTSALLVGGVTYWDRVAQGTPNLAGTPLPAAMTQSMLGGYAAYQASRVEAIGEYLRIANRAAGATTSTTAFYAYAGVHAGDLVPYARYDEIRYPAADPYFPTDDLRLGTLGLRYDAASTVAVKLEVQRGRTATTRSFWALQGQIAVGF